MISLTVDYAYAKDEGKGIARININLTEAVAVPGQVGTFTLDFASAYFLEIRGKFRTVAKCLPLESYDEGKGIIRLDSITRENAGVSIGETVTLRRISYPKEAYRINLFPLQTLSPKDRQRLERDFWFFKDSLESVPLMKGDIVMVHYHGDTLKFQVIGMTPFAEAVRATQMTDFHVAEEGETLSLKEEVDMIAGKLVIARQIPQVTYAQVMHRSREIQLLHEMIEFPLRAPRVPLAAIFYGPSSNKQKIIAMALANAANAHFVCISGGEIMKKSVEECEKVLHDKIGNAKELAPTVFFIDDMDAILDGLTSTTDAHRIVADQILEQIEYMTDSKSGILVISSSRSRDIVDVLKKVGEQKVKSLFHMLNNRLPYHFIELEIGISADPKIQDLSLSKFGGIEMECSELSNGATDRLVPTITYNDIPNLISEELVKVRETIELPLRARYTDLPRGVILSGAESSENKLIAMALANAANSHFINILGTDSAKTPSDDVAPLLKQKFAEAIALAPSIIFLENADTFLHSKSDAASLLGLLINELGGRRVVVIADALDDSDPSLTEAGLISVRKYEGSG